MNLNKPHILFWAFSSVMIILSLFYRITDDTIDIDLFSINIHDTFFLIYSFHLILFISILLFIIGLVYFVHSSLKIRLTKTITNIHIFINIACALTYLIGQLYFKMTILNQNFPLFDELWEKNTFNMYLLFAFIFFQLIFIINSLFSSFKHFLKNKS